MTPAQQKVHQFVTSRRGTTKEEMLAAKLDMHAVNNLVGLGLLVVKNDVYTTPGEAQANKLVQVEPEPPVDLPAWAKEKTPYTGSEAAKRARALQIPEPTRIAPKVKAPRSCLCGCGAKVSGSFKQGHDMKLHQQINLAKKEGRKFSATVEQAEWLATKAWAKNAYEVAT